MYTLILTLAIANPPPPAVAPVAGCVGLKQSAGCVGAKAQSAGCHGQRATVTRSRTISRTVTVGTVQAVRPVAGHLSGPLFLPEPAYLPMPMARPILEPVGLVLGGAVDRVRMVGRAVRGAVCAGGNCR